MAWFLKIHHEARNVRGAPRLEWEDYVALDGELPYCHSTRGVLAATRFGTKEVAEATAVLLTAKRPSLIGRLRLEEIPEIPMRMTF